MPNAPISIYLSDDEYVRYVAKKKLINEKVRNLVRSEIGVGETDEDKDKDL